MTEGQFLTDAARILVNAVFIISAVFPAATALYWAWWRSEWGINIVTLEICIGVTVLPAVLFIDFGIQAIGFRWVQVIALAMVAAVIIWRGVLIWRTQRAAQDKDR